jgi:hypothetical protein
MLLLLLLGYAWDDPGGDWVKCSISFLSSLAHEVSDVSMTHVSYVLYDCYVLLRHAFLMDCFS